jgi:charged multivesicular body protein 5
MEDLLEAAGDLQEVMGRTLGLPQDIDEEELEAGDSFHSFIH